MEHFYERQQPVIPGSLPPFLRDTVPFGEQMDAAEVARLSAELATELELPGNATLMWGTGADGLALDRFRLRAWDGEDPYREALHRKGILAYAAADCGDGWRRMSSAFAAADAHVQGPSWRGQLARAVAPEPRSATAVYLRRFFRAAQQTWTRAARWSSVMPPDATSPFEPLVRLASLGAWPIGWWDGRLFVFALAEPSSFNPAQDGPPEASHRRQGPAPDAPLFLATSFRDLEQGERSRRALEAIGHRVLHGPVPERAETIEAQLGRRIREAAALLAIVDERDPDFGLPLWIQQELRYAVACGRPAALVGAAATPDLGPSPVHEISVGNETTPGAAPEVAHWLARTMTRRT